MNKFVEFHEPIMVDGQLASYLGVRMVEQMGDVTKLHLERGTITVHADNIAQTIDDPTEIDDYEEPAVDGCYKDD